MNIETHNINDKKIAEIITDEIILKTTQLAFNSIKNSPLSYYFAGTAEDYARASLSFSIIENKYGLRGIIEIYKLMNETNTDLFSAIKKKYYLSPAQLEKESLKYIEQNAIRD